MKVNKYIYLGRRNSTSSAVLVYGFCFQACNIIVPVTLVAFLCCELRFRISCSFCALGLRFGRRQLLGSLPVYAVKFMVIFLRKWINLSPLNLEHNFPFSYNNGKMFAIERTFKPKYTSISVFIKEI